MKLLKKLLITFVVVIVLVVGLAVVFLSTLDPNDYKETIAEKVKEETGRELTIDGDIQLSIYPWLGLEVSGVSLSNAAGFGDKPFLKTDQVSARAKFLPLLRKELEMDTLVLHGVTLNLAKNAEGTTNWDDLSKGSAQEKSEAGGELPFAALVLGGIDVKDVNIYWQDQQQDLTAEVTDVAIKTGELQLGQPIDITAGLNVAASKPALSSRIDFTGTVAYEDNGNVLTLKPMQLISKVKGESVPGGEAELRLDADIQVDMDEEVAKINALTLAAFDTEVKAQLEASDYQSGKPKVNGTLDVKGQDLPQLFRIFEIEPLATQLASLNEKQFALNTTFDADLKRNDININPLTLDVLGNQVDANIIARDVQSKTPAIKGNIKANGANLPVLITLASRLSGADKSRVTALSEQLNSAPKPFVIETDFDVDLKAGTAELPKLTVDALGINTSGSITGQQLQSDDPALKGNIDINGKDLPLLVRVAAAYSGDGKQDLSALTKELKSVPSEFSVNAKFDSGSGAIKVSELNVNALGLSSQGNLQVKRYLSDAPAVKGELSAKGPDLPLLLLIAGSMQGSDSGLSSLARDLSKIKDKGFSLSSQFDADSKTGNLELPGFSFKSLGINLEGNLKGKDLQSNGNMEGKLSLGSTSPKPLLTAMGQGDLAQVLQSFSVDTSINGNANRLNLKSLSLKAVVAGKDIPNSPVTLSVNADSVVDLEKEVFELSGLRVDGLGLDVKGNVTAKKFKTAPEFAGKLNIAPVNLRQLLKSLNQDVPKTADADALKHFELSTGFSGTATSINLSELKAKLDDSNLQGDVKLASFSPLNLEFGLGVDQLNLDRYLPPTKKKEQKAATPEAAAVAAATEIPVETLQALKIKGDFVMGKFIVSNATLTDLELSIRADKGDIKLDPIKANLYEGSYSGTITLDAIGKQPQLTTNTKLSKVQTGPLLKDVTGSEDVSGEANIALNLNTSGVNTDVMKQRLSGDGEIKFLDGIFRGVDVNKVLQQVEIMYESKRFGSVDTSGETNFKSLTATMDIKNGVVRNEDMLMKGNGFKVKGEGMMVNLNDETWKYNMTVIVDSSSATSGEERYNIGGYDILIKCRDKVMDKKCLPDLDSMINALVKDTAKKKLQEKLGDAIGIDLPGITSGSSSSEQQIQESTTTETTSEETTTKKKKKKKKQEEEVKPEDLLKEGLKNILNF